VIAKLHEAGVTTVEALADMTPEQLEELPGIGPKTVEKISLAVNNYYLSLDAGQSAAGGAAAGEEVSPSTEAESEAGTAVESAAETPEAQLPAESAEGEPVSTEEPAEPEASSGEKEKDA
jgi:transcription termination/antitermination protein NusA